MRRNAKTRLQVECLEGRIALSNVVGMMPETPPLGRVAGGQVALHLTRISHNHGRATLGFEASPYAATFRHRAAAAAPMDNLVSNPRGITTSPITAFSGAGLTASDDLWYFGGTTQVRNYATSIYIYLNGGTGGGPVTWTITRAQQGHIRRQVHRHHLKLLPGAVEHRGQCPGGRPGLRYHHPGIEEWRRPRHGKHGRGQTRPSLSREG